MGEVGVAVVGEGWVGVEATGWGWFVLEDEVLGCVFELDVVCRFWAGTVGDCVGLGFEAATSAEAKFTTMLCVLWW